MAASLCGWAYSLWLHGAFLPSWIRWERIERAADLDGDGAFEALSLEDHMLRIYEGERLAASTPARWLISDAQAADIDDDGALELVCLAWKRGSFGSARPFWVEQDELEFSQHVFIFTYHGGELRQKWLSSDIGIEVERMELDSLGRLCLTLTDGSERSCEWQEWGLTYLDEETPSMREALFSAATVLAAGDVIAHEGILREAKSVGADASASTGTQASAGSGTDAATDTGAGSGMGTGSGDARYDFSALFSGISGLVGACDIAAVNVEGPLVTDESLVSGSFPLLAAPSELAADLVDSGFNVFEAANNHIFDLGEAGIAQTIKSWEKLGSQATLLGVRPATADDSAPKPSYVEANGMKLALFNATSLVNSSGDAEALDAWQVDQTKDGSKLAAAIAEAESTSDLTICFLHLGEEYAEEPSGTDEQLIRSLIDAGADAVICSHPHVVQRAERLTTAAGNSAYVCYSLGNLAANQPYPETVLGCLARLTIKRPADGSAAFVSSCELIPTVCHFTGSETRVFALEDYTDELASGHSLNSLEAQSITTEGLRTQWLAALL